MARGCCDCTWRCPLYDSEKCAPCRYDAGKLNFESEEYPGYGTKAAAALPKEDEHMKAVRELIEKRCSPVPVYMPILPNSNFDQFDRKYYSNDLYTDW